MLFIKHSSGTIGNLKPKALGYQWSNALTVALRVSNG